MDSQRSWVLRAVLVLGGSAALLALVTSGCRVSSASSEAVQVWGRVTYGGKPLEGGAIIFMPMEDLHTNWGVGQIDSHGMYRLSTYIPKTSLEPGPYRIYLMPTAPTFAQVNGSPKVRREAEKDGTAKVPETPKSPIPERFQKPQSSGIMVMVEQPSNRIDVDLKD
jgi:hypothetical protein